MTDPTHIVAWRRLDERVTTSGQPTEAELAALARLGVAHVINLGLDTHPRALPEEARSVAGMGMTYTHIPVPFDAPDEQHFGWFCEAMGRAAGAKVHVHCIVNARVSAFMYRYRRDILRLDEQRVRREMESVWQPGGVWASFIGDEDAVALPHRPARTES